MGTKLTPVRDLPTPEGAMPFVVSTDISLKLAYPVSRGFAVTPEVVEPLGSHAVESVRAFFGPDWTWPVFGREWLYAVCESGPSCGYRVTNYWKGIANHPLAAEGLRPGNVYEVVGSSAIDDLRAAAANLRAGWPSCEPKHYLFAFDCEVFECMTTNFDVDYVFGDRYEVMAHVAATTKWGQ